MLVKIILLSKKFDIIHCTYIVYKSESIHQKYPPFFVLSMNESTSHHMTKNRYFALFFLLGEQQCIWILQDKDENWTKKLMVKIFQKDIIYTAYYIFINFVYILYQCFFLPRSILQLRLNKTVSDGHRTAALEAASFSFPAPLF